MTHKMNIWWTFGITSAALFMVTLDNLVVTTALPVIRRDLHAGPQRPRVDGERVHPRLRRAAPHGRSARRPLRAPPRLLDRARHLHARLGGGRARAVDRRARRRARGAGPRRRHRPAADADDPLGRRPGRAPRRLPRRVGRDQRAGRRLRPARRRRRRQRHLLALDLLAQRPARPLARAARAPAARRDEGAVRPGRSAGPRPRQRRPVRDRVGPRPGQLGGLGHDRDRRRAGRPGSCSSRRSSRGSCGRPIRCCRCASSATARSPSRTSPRC